MLKPMRPAPIRHLLIIILALMVPATLPAAAQNSLGIGAGEATIPSTGLFSDTLAWINAKQQAFYRSLTGALKAMRDEPAKLWILIGLSFAYGVFHAAGPGHGKAVISSYMLANEIALRRGIALSFLSSLLQGLSALVVIGIVFLFLRGTAISMGDTVRFLEIGSYGLIAAFGGYLLWRKIAPRLFRRRRPATLSAAHSDHHHHGGGEVCTSCGHSHAPDPSLLGGDGFDWKSAWAAVAAVGIRPCSGALIVLTFAFLNQLWIGGIASVFAMSIGTAITVSTLASLAVLAKNTVLRYSGKAAFGTTVHTSIEIIGASLILLIGLLLLSASLSV